ncbi:hypothetical protein ACFWRZ_08200 [Streptomyces rubiginosohelvolus]|uniref:VG15 protein n=1 Tax=Streptomyces rubiginosohelvolus TaxID=67362 RepID=UPI003649BB6B
MAGMSARLAMGYRRRQLLLSTRLVRQVMQAWRELANPAQIDASWTILRSVLAQPVLRAREESAQLATDFYLEARREADIDADGFSPPRPTPLTAERLNSSLDVTGPVEFKRAIASGKTPSQALDQAAVRMAGSTQYLALEGGRSVIRESVEQDERATGYARVTDNDPCAWCAMLASRGPVYKSAQTAGDPRQGGHRYHDLCGCQAVPSFTLDEPFIGIADKLYEDWKRETKGHGGNHAVNAFRRWWEAEGRIAYAPTTSPP